MKRDALPFMADLTANITIKTLGADQNEIARWDAFVESCAEATFFHRAAWRGIMERIFGHRTFFLYAERDGDICGVLPLAQVKSRLFGHALISLPFCVYAGVAATDDIAATALLDAATAKAHKLDVGHLECRNLSNRRAHSHDWSTQDIYFTFRKEILPEVEANMLAIPRKQRAMVRKGIKAGLTSQIDDGVETFFALYAENVHRHGTPALPKRYFAALKQTFGKDCEVLTVRSPEGKPLSSVLTFYFRDEVLPYYAGDDLAARDLAANDFKYWELMRRSCERGLKLFDYGRSKLDTGPYDFKKNWGFTPQPLDYGYQLIKADAVPQNNPLNPKYRAFIALWRRLPLPVANYLGPHIVRNLG